MKLRLTTPNTNIVEIAFYLEEGGKNLLGNIPNNL
jgi:hypothetical protein